MQPRNAIVIGLVLAVSVPACSLRPRAPRKSGVPPLSAPLPPEMLRDVLIDVGPVRGPAVCGCVTAPFIVSRHPGAAIGNGPGADLSAALPPPVRRSDVQNPRDAQDLANMPGDMERALAGDANSAFGLGLLFMSGTAVKRDDAAATRWFRLAARNGHPDAYVQLAHRYVRGKGTRADHKAAAYWFSKGASNGDAVAMTALGSLYASGRGVDQDWDAALYWWQKAGYWRFVGDAYACGLGVHKDYEWALAFYQKGIESGDIGSAVQVGHLHAGRCLARPDDNAAFGAYEKAADRGYPEAQIGLSQLYFEGRGVARDLYRAYLWARMAELRLTPGGLRRLASSRAAAAARRMAPEPVKEADAFVRSMIEGGLRR